MRITLSLLAVFAFTLSLQGRFPVSVLAAEDKTISIPTDDAQMNAAIKKARSGISGFWQRFENPSGGEQGFAVKLKLSDGTHDEHFWCSSIHGTAAAATCEIDNDPQYVKTVKAGQRIRIDAELISDWLYLRGDKIIGGETMRVLLQYLPPEEANGWRARLSED